MSSLFTLLLALTSITTYPKPTTTALLNCTTTVSAGPDVVICDASETATLNGSISGDFISLQWEPANLLNNPNILSPTANLTESTIFTLTVESFSSENLIFNGDFSLGNIGFTSDYQIGNGGTFGALTNEGRYVIDDNANDTHTGFANCPDHTGGGLMMVVNGSNQQEDVWCQVISVDPDTDYGFSAWIATVVSTSPAELLFEINGQPLGGGINAPSTECSWEQFFALWNSGSATTAEICLSNVNLSTDGNDFALDDLAFSPICVSTDEVAVNIANLNADWTSPGIICYNENTIILDNLLAADATSGGIWTINGTPATELTASDFTSPVILEVEYSLQNGACSESNIQNITIGLEPTADFSVSETEACVEETVTLTYQGNMGISATYNWDFGGMDASPGTGQGPQEVSSDTPGTYIISLTVEFNGCLSQVFTQTIEVVAPSITDLGVTCVSTDNSVEFQWPANSDITAYIPSVTSGQTTGVSTSPTTYLVTGLMPGEIVDIQILAFFASGACGSATFTASCAATTCPSITATLGAVVPICAGSSTSIDLSIVGDAGPYDISYDIGGIPATISGAGATTSIPLSPAQTEVFTINSIINTNFPDCSISLPAPVTIQVDQPLEAGTAQMTTPICEGDGNTPFDLNSLLDGADTGGNWTETSSSTGGAFDPSTGTFDPSTQMPGTYTFIYTQNAGNTCPESSTTISIEIGAIPVADAGQDFELDCDITSTMIGGNTSSQGNTISYEWTTMDGGTIPDPTAATNEISTEGTYTLTVRDEITGCAATDEITITSSNATVEVFATASPTTCLAPTGGSIQIDSLNGGTGPYTFSIDGQTFIADSSFTDLPAGQYELIAEDMAGCQAIIALTIDAPKDFQASLSTNTGELDPIVNAGDPIQLNLDFTDDPSNIDTIVWEPAILECNNCNNPVITPVVSGIYTATVTTLDGCTASTSITVTVVTSSERIFIPNAFSPNDDGFNDVFFINAAPEVLGIKEMQIMDRWGNQVFEAQGVPANDPNFGWDGSFRGKRLNPGVFVYYVELELLGGISVVRAGELNLMF